MAGQVGRPVGYPKSGGKKKGYVHKNTQEVIALLDKLNCNPIEGMVMIATGKAKCLMCVKGKVTIPQFHGMTNTNMHISKDESIDEISDQLTSCPVCGGSGIQPINPTLAGKMFSELAQYVAPKRRSIEPAQDDEGQDAFVQAAEIAIAEVKQLDKPKRKT